MGIVADTHGPYFNECAIELPPCTVSPSRQLFMAKVPTGEVLQLPVPGQSLGADNMIATEEFVM